MKLDVRTVVVPYDRVNNQLLLLQRSPSKKLFPNLITGIGGKVELDRGEGEELIGSLLRELHEETPQLNLEASDLKLRLVTHDSRPGEIVVLLWFTCDLKESVTDMSCSEGHLIWADANQLPLADMVPTARDPITFITSLPETDQTIYDAIYDMHDSPRLVAWPNF